MKNDVKLNWQMPVIKNELPVNETLGCCDTGGDMCGFAEFNTTLTNPETGEATERCTLDLMLCAENASAPPAMRGCRG